MKRLEQGAFQQGAQCLVAARLFLHDRLALFERQEGGDVFGRQRGTPGN